MTTRLGKPPLTRAHGSWAIFFVPMIIGFVVADALTVNSSFYLLAAVGVFLSHHPLEVYLLRGAAERKDLLFWSAAFAAFGGAWSCVLLVNQYWALVPIAGLGAVAAHARLRILRNRGKGIMSDWIGAGGLSLGAPAAYYVTTGRLDGLAVLAWVACVLFFGSTVFYVHMRIEAMKLKSPELSMKQRLSLGKLNLLYHVGVILLVLGAAVGVGTASAFLLVVVPMVVHALWGTARLSGTMNLKRLGLIMMVQSVVFVVLVVISGKDGIL